MEKAKDGYLKCALLAGNFAVGLFKDKARGLAIALWAFAFGFAFTFTALAAFGLAAFFAVPLPAAFLAGLLVP